MIIKKANKFSSLSRESEQIFSLHPTKTTFFLSFFSLKCLSPVPVQSCFYAFHTIQMKKNVFYFLFIEWFSL